MDLANNTAQRVESSLHTQGGSNTLLLHLLAAPSTSAASPSLLLASLQDSKQNLSKEYFALPDIQEGFSTYTPNVAFTHKGDKAQWSLELKSHEESGSQNSGSESGGSQNNAMGENLNYFSIRPNAESLNRANGLFNQVLLGYVIEWNNLQKRMGELRENPKAVGAWVRTFGGGSSEGNYRGNFFEVQLGSDYQLPFRGGKLYVGGLLNYTRNLLQGVGTGAQSNGYGAGVYVSALFDSGVYVDSVLRYVYKEHSIDASFIPNGAGGISGLSGASGGNTLLFSVEGGYRLTLEDFFTHRAFRHFYLEPQVELIAGYLQGAKWQNAIVSLELRDSVPVSVKPALFVGKRFFFSPKGAGAHAACASPSRTRPASQNLWRDSKDTLDSPPLHSLSTDSHTPQSPKQSAQAMSDCLTPQDQSLGMRFGLGGAIDMHRYGDRILRDRSGARELRGIADSRMFASLALDYVLSERLRFHLEFERSFFGILNIDWLASANMRVGF